MSGKYHHRESAAIVVCPVASCKRDVRTSQPASQPASQPLLAAPDLIGLSAALSALVAIAFFVSVAPVVAEERPQQMEFARAPAAVAEQNAELSESREAEHCTDCGSQAKILLAWDYPAVDEFLVFYASNPNAEFAQLTPVAPVVRAANGEYEIEIDAGLELGAAIGEQVCFKVQAESVTGDFVSADEDTAASAVMCSELQS